MTVYPPHRKRRRLPGKGVGLAFLFVGLAAVLASALGVFSGPSYSSWSQDEADRYSDAGLRLHQLTYARPTPDNRAELARVAAEYQRLRGELGDARQAGGRFSRGLLIAGLGMMAVGVPLSLRRAG